MKIISFNANGIRAATRKGFFDWFREVSPDVLCVQETKAQRHQLDDEIYHPEGWYSYYVDAEKKGYSGVAIYTKQKPLSITDSLEIQLADVEGRYIEVEFENLIVASLYLPSGSSGDIRQDVKMQFLAEYQEKLSEQIKRDKPMVVCGDFNIVHKEIDIKNWKQNQKTSGVLPEERAWLDLIFDDIGWVDAFRVVNKESEQYTWWSNRGQARAKNVGWRIDYHITSPDLKDSVQKAWVYKENWFSDHAPLILEYDYSINA
jgi:exodeoxyribonuclease-3